MAKQDLWENHVLEIEDLARSLDEGGRGPLARALRAMLEDASDLLWVERERDEFRRQRALFFLVYEGTPGKQDVKLRAAAKALGFTAHRADDWGPNDLIGDLRAKPFRLARAYAGLRLGERSLHDWRVQDARKPSEWTILFGRPEDLIRELRDPKCDRASIGVVAIYDGPLFSVDRESYGEAVIDVDPTSPLDPAICCELIAAFFGLASGEACAAELRKVRLEIRKLADADHEGAREEEGKAEALAEELGGECLKQWRREPRSSGAEHLRERGNTLEALLEGLSDVPHGFPGR